MPLPSHISPRLLVPLLVAAGTIACTEQGGAPPAPGPVEGAPSGPVWFREVAAEAGVTFRHHSGAREGRLLFPEIMGGGAALADLDGDGDLDLYLVQSGTLELDAPSTGNALYANDGAGRFSDVSATSGADDRGYGMGVATGDVDDDGRLDLYVTNVGPNVLLRGRGELRFEPSRDVPDVPVWSTSAAFLDHDADGDLDLFVCNYVGWSADHEAACTTPSGRPDYCSPLSYSTPLPDTLLRNDGAGGFVDVSVESGIAVARGNGLGVVTGDLDGDGRIDLFVANDQVENHLWHNEGAGRFTNVAVRAGCALDQHGQPKAGMGTVAEDLDDDGDLDLLVVNLRAQSDSFYRNDGGVFRDDTAAVGLASASRPFTRFGVGLHDFDQDGWLDLYEANGRVVIASESTPRSPDPYAEPNLLLVGRSGGRLEALTAEGGVAPPLVHTSRAAAFGDLDGDGAVDVVVVNRDGPVHVLQNVAPGRGHWIRFAVLERHGRDALGAELRIELGDRTLRRDVRTAYSYCAASDPRIHLGLGSRTEISRVEVRWPTGEREVFGPFGSDQDVVLRQGSGASR